MTLDLLETMMQILDVIGTGTDDLPHVFMAYDHAHDARINDDLYIQRPMTETANSSVKRSYDSAVRARD
jgi:hypothetical protein